MTYPGIVDVIIQAAKDRLFNGKGKDRHGVSEKIEDNQFFKINNAFHGFIQGQIMKKMMELEKLDGQRKIDESIDIVCYAILLAICTRIENENSVIK